MLEPSTEFIQRTLDVFQPFSPEPLTEEDAREIITNMSGFFGLLMKWDAAERADERSAESVH